MTYGLFLAIFLLPPVLCLIWLSRDVQIKLWLAIVVLAAVAIIYTAPWDSAIIRNGVWTYGSHQVIGVILAEVPIEEYVFYVLQVVLSGLLTAAVLKRLGR